MPPRATFRDVFAVREFRALWFSEILSVAGDRLALVALTLLVYDRTGLPLLAAITYAAGYLPWVIGGLFLADVADRHPRRTVMVVCDVVRAVLVAAMALPGVPLLALVALLFATTMFTPPFGSPQAGIDAMRFKSKGGTRPDDVGMAPAYWGMTEAQYKQKADLWPLNPDGELVNWTIVESKEGLAHVREIAAGQGHRRAVAGRRHAARRVLDHQRRQASASSIRPAGRTRFRRCWRRARNSTCRAASRRRRPTSRCA